MQVNVINIMSIIKYGEDNWEVHATGGYNPSFERLKNAIHSFIKQNFSQSSAVISTYFTNYGNPSRFIYPFFLYYPCNFLLFLGPSPSLIYFLK
jgi:hypothetical protein